MMRSRRGKIPSDSEAENLNDSDDDFNLLATPEFNPPPRVVEEVGRLIHYFKLFFSEQTNLYATQLDANEPLTLTHQELEVILGTVIYIIPQMADAMRRKRWKMIKRHLHFNDKSNLPTGRIDPNYDKLFKIRPVVDHLLHIFQNKEKHQKLLTDHSLQRKQYNPRKPNKRCYKVFVLNDSKGLVHNFELYTGKLHPALGKKDTDASENIVLRLASIIPIHQNH
ncbi:hypothetical protein ILUMI_04378 [Ignelater luminosus]|uniref:PiggyBac transposable element-derived protein domain-containing protein n=1 Tax=Ignelater luminosus TaxID=2038154 RepID=A0A8K0D9T6_IGNLU|nr:hypothetical protein ILUMI_04378 [Ignelater luminosus]